MFYCSTQVISSCHACESISTVNGVDLIPSVLISLSLFSSLTWPEIGLTLELIILCPFCDVFGLKYDLKHMY